MAVEELLPTAEPRTTYSAGDVTTPPDLRLLHFNDGPYPQNTA